MQFRINQDECIGSGECVLRAPATFELSADDIAFVRDDAQRLSADLAHAIAENCPGAAISLTDGAAEK